MRFTNSNELFEKPPISMSIRDTSPAGFCPSFTGGTHRSRERTRISAVQRLVERRIAQKEKEKEKKSKHNNSYNRSSSTCNNNNNENFSLRDTSREHLSRSLSANNSSKTYISIGPGKPTTIRENSPVKSSNESIPKIRRASVPIKLNNLNDQQKQQNNRNILNSTSSPLKSSGLIKNFTTEKTFQVNKENRRKYSIDFTEVIERNSLRESPESDSGSISSSSSSSSTSSFSNENNNNNNNINEDVRKRRISLQERFQVRNNLNDNEASLNQTEGSTSSKLLYNLSSGYRYHRANAAAHSAQNQRRFSQGNLNYNLNDINNCDNHSSPPPVKAKRNNRKISLQPHHYISSASTINRFDIMNSNNITGGGGAISKYKLCDDTLNFPGCCVVHDKLNLGNSLLTTNNNNNNQPRNRRSTTPPSRSLTPNSLLEKNQNDFETESSISSVSGSGMDFFRKFVQRKKKGDCKDCQSTFRRNVLIKRLVDDSIKCQSHSSTSTTPTPLMESDVSQCHFHSSLVVDSLDDDLKSTKSSSTVSGSGFLFLRNYLRRKKSVHEETKDLENIEYFNSAAIPFPPPKDFFGPFYPVLKDSDLNDEDIDSIGSTIADLLNETFNSDDSELKKLEWNDDEEHDLLDGISLPNDDEEEEEGRVTVLRNTIKINQQQLNFPKIPLISNWSSKLSPRSDQPFSSPRSSGSENTVTSSLDNHQLSNHSSNNSSFCLSPFKRYSSLTNDDGNSNRKRLVDFWEKSLTEKNHESSYTGSVGFRPLAMGDNDERIKRFQSVTQKAALDKRQSYGSMESIINSSSINKIGNRPRLLSQRSLISSEDWEKLFQI